MSYDCAMKGSGPESPVSTNPTQQPRTSTESWPKAQGLMPNAFEGMDQLCTRPLFFRVQLKGVNVLADCGRQINAMNHGAMSLQSEDVRTSLHVLIRSSRPGTTRHDCILTRFKRPASQSRDTASWCWCLRVVLVGGTKFGSDPVDAESLAQ